MSRTPRRARVAMTALLAATVCAACTGGNGSPRASGASAPTTDPSKRPLPPTVHVRATAQGVALGDPAFPALSGARADYGHLGGAVYQIEMPVHWNGRLVLYMHGFEDLGPIAQVTAPDFRRYLIANGFAWGASSFSSTGLIPGRSADETAALWDYFARKYGRPSRTYVTGLSMGGMAANIAAERYGSRFDGALALCGSAGQTPAVMADADFFAAGAYAAGVTQKEFDASTDIHALIYSRILGALRNPEAHRRFEDIMIDLSGGPRAFDREGFEAEEATNWHRAELLVAAHLAPNRDTHYRLGPLGSVTSEQFNRAVIRLPANAVGLRNFVAGNETTGRLEMPLLSMHTTGDFQVPIEQARILQRRVDAAGRQSRLVQRVVPDPGHCGFTTPEQVAGFEALVAWVEHGERPAGTNVLTSDLRTLDRTFALTPRAGTAEADAVVGAHDRVVIAGRATLDGVPFDAQFMGAVIVRGGLVTPCQYTLSPVTRGRYTIVVLGTTESTGCGARDARIVLWTFAHDHITYAGSALAWPGNGRTITFDPRFSTSDIAGVAPATSEFQGDVFRRDGSTLPPGTRVEAYVGATRCGIASTRRTGSFTGYILAVVGPESVAACAKGATLTFRVDGRPALETAPNRPAGQGSFDLTLA